MNVARDGQGKAPSPRTCSQGKWLKAINKTGTKHETFVIVDDRDHKKGNLYKFVAAKIDGASPQFPVVFVLDHDGRLINKSIQGLKLPDVIKLVKAQEKVYDKALAKAKKSKSEDSKDESEDKEKDKE